MIPVVSILGFLPSILGWYRAKQEAKLAWYKIIWEAVCNITKFVIKHIKVFIVLAILAYTYYSFNKLQTQRDSAISELNGLKQAIQLETIQREAENKIKSELGKLQVKNITEKHQQELESILRKQKGLKNEIAINQRDIANYRDSLRTTIESYQSTGLPNDDTYKLTCTDSDTAVFERLQAELSTCKEAGALAANDYNFCKSYVDNEQSRLGVEP